MEPGFKNDDVFWASAVKNLETCVLQREVSYLPVASAVPLSKQPGASQAEQNANQKASVPPRPPTVQEEAGEYMADADQQQTWSKPMPYHPMPVSVGEMAGNKQGALNTNPFEQNGLSPSSQEFAVEPETTGLQTIHQPKPKYSNALEEMGGEFMGSPGMGYVVVAFLLVLFLALAAACILLCYRSRTDAPTEEHEEHEEQPGNAVDAAEDTIDKKGKSAVGPENEDPSRISSTATPSTTSVKEAQREGLDVACPKHFMPSNSTVSRVPPGFTYHAGYSSPVQSDISSICGLQQYRVQRPYPVGHEQPSVMRRSGDGYPAIAMRRSTEDSDGWTHPPVRISNPTSNSRRKAREHSTNDGILYM